MFEPEVVFILGDWVDFYSVSKYDRDPKRRFTLANDLAMAQEGLARVRDVAPKAEIVFLKGNHEDRLRRYLWTVAPELSGLPSLKIEQLLAFDAIDIKYVEGGATKFHGFIVKHGNVVRKHSAYSARAELDNVGTSGVSGHTHRLGQHFKTNTLGMFSWTECGCLCKMNQDYIGGAVPNWQHGVGYGYFKKKDRRFEVHALPIVHGKMVWSGREIKG